MNRANAPIWFFLLACICNGCQKNQNNGTPHTSDSTSRASDSTWEWLGKPLGDSLLNTITIDPKDDQTWYVTAARGLYITRNGGSTWTHYLGGNALALEIVPGDPSKIFVGADTTIYLSTDHGLTWTLLHNFSNYVVSILVSKIDKAVYVGVAWEDSPIPNGIYKSNDMGKTWNYYSYGVQARGLIPWDIEEDSANNKLYIGTEIYDHPQPYYPPYLRSSDGGITWQDIRGTITWHVVSTQVQPGTNDVYAFTEGAGIFYSHDFGDHWLYMHSPSADGFIIDKNHPERFFSGNPVYGQFNGGVFEYDGHSYNEIHGMEGKITASLCLNAKSTYLYVASYNSGLYRKKLE